MHNAIGFHVNLKRHTLFQVQSLPFDEYYVSKLYPGSQRVTLELFYDNKRHDIIILIVQADKEKSHAYNKDYVLQGYLAARRYRYSIGVCRETDSYVILLRKDFL